MHKSETVLVVYVSDALQWVEQPKVRNTHGEEIGHTEQDAVDAIVRGENLYGDQGGRSANALLHGGIIVSDGHVRKTNAGGTDASSEFAHHADVPIIAMGTKPENEFRLK